MVIGRLDSGSSSPGLSPGRDHCVVFMGKILYCQCLSPPRCINGCWEMWFWGGRRGNPVMDYHSIQVESKSSYSCWYVWVIDQGGQDGWLLAKFLFCVFMDWDRVEVHKLRKKRRGKYPAILTEQAWSIKDFLYGFRGNFSCGTQQVVPSGQDSSIFAVLLT